MYFQLSQSSLPFIPVAFAACQESGRELCRQRLKHIRLPTLCLCLIVSLLAGPFKPADAGFRTQLQLPEALSQDTDLLERYWVWLLRQTNAPSDLPFPDITIEEMQSNIRMQLLRPGFQNRSEQWRIAISPQTIKRAEQGERLIVLSEVGHELVHHLLLLQEHQWSYSRSFYNPPKHRHCDQEFQYLVAGVAQVIWSAYHSSDLVRAVEQMNQKACWEGGHVLADSTSK